MENKNKEGNSIGGLVFVGCMFIGAGLGFLYHSIIVGGAIGMGVGFLAHAAVKAYYANK